MWPGQPGRSLPNPAPGPLSSSLSLSFCLFERPSERPASLPSPAVIENALPPRPLAAPLTTLFLVDLHASSPEARTWKIGRGRQYEATNEGNAASSGFCAFVMPFVRSHAVEAVQGKVYQ